MTLLASYLTLVRARPAPADQEQTPTSWFAGVRVKSTSTDPWTFPTLVRARPAPADQEQTPTTWFAGVRVRHPAVTMDGVPLDYVPIFVSEPVREDRLELARFADEVNRELRRIGEAAEKTRSTTT